MRPDTILDLPDLEHEVLAPEHGVTGTLWRVRWSGDSGVHTAVLKVSEQVERARREQRFYRTFTPCPGVPRCLDQGEHDGLPWLLLEDLVDALRGDILDGVHGERAVAMAGALGALHGRWWGRMPAGWAVPPRPVPEGLGDDARAFAARYGEAPCLVDLPARVHRARTVLSEAPTTLCHADAHLDNWVFTPAPVLLDWQTARESHGAVDLCRILLEGVRPELRADCQGAMVEAWRSALPGVDGAHARRWVRAALVTSLGALVPWAAHADRAAMAPRIRRIADRCARHALAMAHAWDAV